MSTNNMDRFEFRCIRPEETQQAIEIEQICFPPNEACSPKSLTERIKATAETSSASVSGLLPVPRWS